MLPYLLTGHVKCNVQVHCIVYMNANVVNIWIQKVISTETYPKYVHERILGVHGFGVRFPNLITPCTNLEQCYDQIYSLKFVVHACVGV